VAIAELNEKKSGRKVILFFVVASNKLHIFVDADSMAKLRTANDKQGK